MGDRRFPILGSERPRMLGRTRLMEQIWKDLTKRTPSNLSLVGPRYIGKTVLMEALAQRAQRPDSPYAFVLPWHLGHVAPASDEDFVARLCDLLRDVLATSKGEYADHRELLSDRSFACLQEITDSLDNDNKAILMLWDGFDKPLGQGRLSVDLWDRMRSIFDGKRHKIVTATRDRLDRLLRSQEAISSPFWNIFDMDHIPVNPFDEEERDGILCGLAEYNFHAGAKTELRNWTAGYPPLFLDVLNQIVNDNPQGTIDNEAVNQAAQKTIERISTLLSDLWDDCPAGAKDVYCDLTEHGEMLLSEVGKETQNCLKEKGIVWISGNKLKPACRMLQQYLKETNRDTGNMIRLFGTWDNYRSNIRGLLEYRLAQIARFDDLLYRLIARSIEDIPEYPNQCLNNLTGIEERALDLIWRKEYGPNKTIPQETIDYWNRVNPKDKMVCRLEEPTGNLIPGDRSLQCRLLQLLTGSSPGFDSKAKYISKDTYVLINALHSFRNRNQHAAGQTMHVGVAVAAITLCLELLACLERELFSRSDGNFSE